MKATALGPLYMDFFSFFGEQSRFWQGLPPQKVSLTSEAYKCPKGLVCGLLTKWEPHFSSLFSLFSLHFLQWMAKILAFSFWFWLLQYISTAESHYIQQCIVKFCSNFEKIKIFECGLLTNGCINAWSGDGKTHGVGKNVCYCSTWLHENEGKWEWHLLPLLSTNFST